MLETTSDNKRIAKNTMMLYIRMFFTMAVSLYTSRIVINTLGVTDYGIYGVVGGIISMFTFLNGAMSSATQRYINFNLGRNEVERLKSVFRTALQIHVVIALVVFILGETVGLWFVCTQLVIPPERLTSAVWVYHFSVFGSMASIICLPFNAEIIAHERMSAFAYLSILDAVLKLVIVYILVVTPFDRLIFYGFLFLCVGLMNCAIYVIYCKRNFEEINLKWSFDSQLLSEMTNFAGWSLWGNVAYILFTQGINILLNIFFGPVVNAARSVAVSVQGVVQGFAANVQLAMNPQITKSYAIGDLHRMHQLIFASSKFCFYLLFIIILPLAIEAKQVLTVWLGIVPEHTVWFLRLILMIMLTEALANPYIIANQATGKVKKYQAVCGGLLLMIVPVAYVVLRLGGNSESVFIVHFSIAIITQSARVYMMRNLIDLSISVYINKVLVPIFAVVALSPILPLWAYFNMGSGFLSFLLVCLCCLVSSFVMISFAGITKHERAYIFEKSRNFVLSKIRR